MRRDRVEWIRYDTVDGWNILTVVFRENLRPQLPKPHPPVKRNRGRVHRRRS